MSKVLQSITLPSSKYLTEDDHPDAVMLTETEFLTHYGDFYYMRTEYNRDGSHIVPFQIKTPCVNWMMCSGFYQMADSEFPERWKGNPPFDLAVHREGAFGGLYEHEGFYHKCKDVWHGSWFERWARISIMRMESNLDLWRMRASGNDDTSYTKHIIGESRALGYLNFLKRMPENTITPDWCSENGWFFSN